MPSSFHVRLQQVETLCRNTLGFRFALADGGVELEPGQFFRFTLRDEAGEFERSYSLCNESVAGTVTELDLVVSAVPNGRATRVLWQARPGFECRIEGPYGRLLIPDPLPARLVLVATSVGIAPFVPMLSVLKSLPVETLLLFGVRDPAEMLYADLLQRQLETSARFDLRVCYSQALPSTPSAHDHAGRVTARVASISPDPARDHFLLCGNPHMIDEVYDGLRAAGFRPRQVTREKYVFAREASSERKALTPAQKRLVAEKLAKLRKD